MRKFKINRDYHDNGYDLYKKRTITINPGVTVLTGCNGIGKSTLLNQMKEQLKKDKIPFIMFDNLHDGGSNSLSEAGFFDDYSFMSMAMCSSEGENIILNIGKLAGRLKSFVKTGVDEKEQRYARIAELMAEITGDATEETEPPKERWILLDAVDSGLSVDNIVDVKDLFNIILENSFGSEIYIVVSANEYEMARGEQCFDVYNGKYVQFKDYEEYRSFIMDSRKWKGEREEDKNV